MPSLLPTQPQAGLSARHEGHAVDRAGLAKVWKTDPQIERRCSIKSVLSLLFVIPAQAGIQFTGTESPPTLEIERHASVLAWRPSCRLAGFPPARE
ncbi:MAG: hypothetical protein JWP89_6239 [Schlesneria sp.]|nr:hypothetical protein [Schlesneria sp.]